MYITKSTRHAKIIGDFGEMLICNWLSRSGFEVTVVDHTGIDIIAYHQKTGQRLGITVKSRTRSRGTENDSVNLFNNKKKVPDRKKVLESCQAFSCEPWIGVYVETSEYADVYLTSLENYDQNYRGAIKKVTEDWKMKNKEMYMNDRNVKHLRLEFISNNWSWC